VHDRPLPEAIALDGFAALIEETTGLSTPESNRSHLRRVVGRLAAVREVSPEDLLAAARRDSVARQELVNAAMIGETYLFRESVHFRYLRDRVVPERARPGKRFTAWSASASTGEEAISLAVVISDALRRVPGVPLQVYAGDVRSDLIERLRDGRYPWTALRRDGEEFHASFRAECIASSDERSFVVAPAILELIQPLHLNAYRDDLGVLPDDLDVVFFRNTLIYAGRPNRDRFIERIVTRMAPGGYLFLANSELPFVRHPELELLDDRGVYCFRRRAAAPSASAAEVTRVARAEADVATDSPATTATAPSDAGTPSPKVPVPGPDSPGFLIAVTSLLDLPDLSGIGASGDDDSSPGSGSGDTESDDGEAGFVQDVAETVVRFYAELEEQRFDRAALTLEELGAALPDHPLTHFCRGWLAYTTGEVDTALTEFSAALGDDPRIWPARFYRGLLLSRRDRDAARAEFERCMKVTGPEAPEFRFFMGGFTRAHIRTVAGRWMETHNGS
jgi:chemotaxis protein methyltransferase CheR